MRFHITRRGLVISLLTTLAAILLIAAIPNLTSGLVCTQGYEDGDCITIWNAGNISVYSNQGGDKRFSVDGNTGNVNTKGQLMVRETPVFWATAAPTATPAVRYGTTPAAAKQVCKQVLVLAEATVIAPGITTPRAATYGMADNAAPDHAFISHIAASGVVTVSVWSVAATPAATAVPIDICIIGN